MISDLRATFAAAVSVAHAAGTILVGDVIDRGVANDVDMEDLYLVIQAAAGITTSGSAGTIDFSLASFSTSSIPTDGSANIHFRTGGFVTGSTAIPAGSVLAVIEIPRGSGIYGQAAYKRYLGLLCTITTTTTNAGAISAFVTPDGARWAAVAQAVN